MSGLGGWLFCGTAAAMATYLLWRRPKPMQPRYDNTLFVVDSGVRTEFAKAPLFNSPRSFSPAFESAQSEDGVEIIPSPHFWPRPSTIAFEKTTIGQRRPFTEFIWNHRIALQQKYELLIGAGVSLPHDDRPMIIDSINFLSNIIKVTIVLQAHHAYYVTSLDIRHLYAMRIPNVLVSRRLVPGSVCIQPEQLDWYLVKNGVEIPKPIRQLISDYAGRNRPETQIGEWVPLSSWIGDSDGSETSDAALKTSLLHLTF